MNITHVATKVIEGDKLKAIFEQQRSLMEKYESIEAKSGLLQTADIPVKLDDKRGQARLKDFSWRVTEELGEALDAMEEGDQPHFQEELIDGLHFLTELTILAGKNYDTISTFEPYQGDENDHLQMLFNDGVDKDIATIQLGVTKFIQALGMTCNCLKNKPWKQSQMLTDKEVFYDRLEQTWIYYMAILNCANMNPTSITDIYFKKATVNQFRQRSNY